MLRAYKTNSLDMETGNGEQETLVKGAAPPPFDNTKSAPSTAELLTYSAVFFLAMVVHEVALEAASTSFSHLDALTSTVTLFQFGFCFFLPVAISGPASVWATFPRTSSEVAPYARLSAVVFGATALSTKSLSYVSYPTKVVFKSAKLIPTMIVSAVVNPLASRYGPLDYASATLLCAGAAGYSFGSSAGGGGGTAFSPPGIALLTVSVVCDALVPNLQQKLMDPPASRGATRGTGAVDGRFGLSAVALMVNVNAVGFAGLLLCMILSGSLESSVRVALADPTLLLYLTLVGIGLSTAVLAYTRLIRGAGSVVAVAVATLRKVATVVLSYVICPKPLLSVHVISGCLVLTGILLSIYSRQRTAPSSSSTSE